MYYKSIDEMPLFNWRKCQEQGLLMFSRIEGKTVVNARKWVVWLLSFVYKRGKFTTENDLKAWEKIYDSYLAEFGLGDDYEYLLDLKQRITEVNLDIAISGDKFLLNKSRRLQEELDEFIARPSEGDTDTAIVYLSKWLGYNLNQKEVTVREFYKMLRDYKRENDAQKAKNGKG